MYVCVRNKDNMTDYVSKCGGKDSHEARTKHSTFVPCPLS